MTHCLVINFFRRVTVDYFALFGADFCTDSITLACTGERVKEYPELSRFLILDNFESDGELFAKALALHRERPITSVVALTEDDLLRAARLRDVFGISFHGEREARVFRDKVIMKEAARSAVAVPHFARASDCFDAVAFATKHGYPVVVKPRCGQGSCGVSVLRDEQKLIEFFLKPPREDLEIESYVDGQLFHVDGLVVEGEVVGYSASQYINAGCLRHGEVGYIASVTLGRDHPLEPQLAAAVTRIHKALPVAPVMAFHTELFVTGSDEIVFCETAARVGGGMAQEVTMRRTGLDLTRTTARAQAGLPIEVLPRMTNEYCGSITVCPRHGRLLSAPDEIPFSWVFARRFYHVVGKSYTGPLSSGDAVVDVAVCGDSPEQVRERLLAVFDWTQEAYVWESEEKAQGVSE